MSAPYDARGLRGGLSDYVPNWLSNKRDFNFGFTVLWVIALMGDILIQYMFEGLRAAWPGRGTSTALPLIGISRGLLRDPYSGETDDHFALRLQNWRVTAHEMGSQLGIARQIYEYLGGNVRVRVVNRNGKWTTINADGTVASAQQAFDWDSVSNPERANFWSDEWVIVYPDPWAYAGTLGADGVLSRSRTGIGHTDTTLEYGDVKNSLLATWKAVHSNVRAIIWTTDASLFDPATPASLPNGNWGMWSQGGSGSRVASDRNTTTCRYWE